MLLGRDYLEESVMSLDIIAGRLDNIKCLNLISLVDIDADFIAPFFMKLKSSNLKSLTLDGFFFPGYSNNIKNMLMLADSYSNLQHLKLKMPSRDYPLAKEHNLMTILFSKMDESKITKLELELRSALIINFSFLANKTRKVKYLHLTVHWISKEHILTFLRSASKTLESLNIFSSETTILPVSFIDTLDMYLGRTMINRIVLILGKTEITGLKINGHYEYLTESLQEDQ
ncbi:hypothetical protein ROZALSC1DRAFT_31318 [Rozella allomycis CSF55]|uniref:F-box domain-containing protein n=1 Tax=Rozella allomycis (strain CSF55) TaxID=988480 RepID=A0A075AQF4_ROZAC|nr:hypothetical protein O9G_005933 [Rozella allomycis CSF55]RKP16826.1 hypothetical protein ROZALSC1DRAFT_31318 [Rozella allomycis CSF55]|eukprot:EPZ32390.1 hypothetical protein O9G_005933 [Rozella allomycis CSF55]